jgi:putative methionine-R-sulfoxide reductase with GAF domain
MAIPLVACGKLVGILDLQSTQPNAFTAYERQMIQPIASPIALTNSGLPYPLIRRKDLEENHYV